MFTGPAKKLIIYVDEKDKIHHKPVYEAVVDILYRNHILGLSVFRGIGGYGSNGVLHTTKILELSTDLPVKIEAIDSEARIFEVLPDIAEIVEKGMIEVSDTNVIKCCRKKENAETG
ncbi:MAG: DUF190 domain-containing protein [Thermoleophilia bacterium]|nr:DUF190 domain-containing protein [Actinomycetota bacterium]MCL6092947.1 DUF190 domain-containing protein [Actinomycetota bacterium]MDA8167721.1 DUF190 domain-containing protein [Actinomycetota bacterium]